MGTFSDVRKRYQHLTACFLADAPPLDYAALDRQVITQVSYEMGAEARRRLQAGWPWQREQWDQQGRHQSSWQGRSPGWQELPQQQQDSRWQQHRRWQSDQRWQPDRRWQQDRRSQQDRRWQQDQGWASSGNGWSERREGQQWGSQDRRRRGRRGHSNGNGWPRGWP